MSKNNVFINSQASIQMKSDSFGAKLLTPKWK